MFTPPVATRGPSPLLSVAAVLVGLWVVGVTAVQAGATWLVTEVALEIERPVPTIFAPFVGVLGALLIAGSAWLLATVARRAGRAAVQAAGVAWACTGLAAGAIGCVRVVALPQNELLLALTAAVAAGAALTIRRLRGRSSDPVTRPRRWAGYGLAGGLVVAIPWLWVGALGGVVETILAVTAAATVGWLGATVLDAGFIAPFARSRAWQVVVGGLVAGVALAPLAAAVGGSALHLAEFAIVPATGFAAAALFVAGRPARWGVALLVGGAALGPLAFADPEETSIVLGVGDVGTWALLAAVLGALVALSVGLAYGVVLSPRRQPAPWLPLALCGVAAAACLGVYGGAGQPGFFGERLLVVMAEQADLSGLDAIADRPARLKATYARLVSTAERTQAPLRRELDRFGIRYTPYYLVNAVLVDAGPAARAFLSGRSDVDRVLLDERLRPLPEPVPVETGDQPAPSGAAQWNISLVRADKVWKDLKITGRGIVVGSSDSGIDGDHPALKAGFRGGDDSWYDPWNGTRTPTDHGGHGTHTIATAVGRAGVGVAPDAQWVGCVNLDRNLGSPSRYLDCLQFMLAPFRPGSDPLHDGRPERAPQILTNSWGCPPLEGCDLDALRPATAALAAAGIMVVVAAGNTGPDCSTVVDAPAPYRDVLTVGAVDRDRAVASFSSRGPAPDGAAKPDVSGPGVDVLSALPGGTYGLSSGTSMATPHLAGVVALMWSANPKLIGNIAATTRILRDTATPAKPTPNEPAACGTTNAAGAGIVDAYAAVQAAKAAA